MGERRLQNLVAQVEDGIYCVAVWDSSWNAYNNCYAVEAGVLKGQVPQFLSGLIA